MVHRHLSSFSQMRYQPRLLELIIFLLVKYVMYIYADMFFFFSLGKGKLPQSDPRRARFSVNAGIWNVRGDARSLVESAWHEYL